MPEVASNEVIKMGPNQMKKEIEKIGKERREYVIISVNEEGFAVATARIGEVVMYSKFYSRTIERARRILDI